MSNLWQESVVYQVYLRSFQDSNGDGIGDFRGLIDRLDYLQDLGIDAIWVNPFYESPQVDFGYDISNHKAVDPCYGTMEDFEDLVEEAAKRDIKIIVDIILNHTSDQHPFFQESRRSRSSPKRDWYIWRDGKSDGSPPNNWEGFERSTWTFDSNTNQYYYHFFYRQQPDINWRNPEVVQEMFDICDFWLNKGAAALRLDAINYLVEDPQLRDNPIVEKVPDYLRNVFQFDQNPIHTIDHPDNHQILKQLRQHLQTNHENDPLLVGEVWVPTPKDLVQYYGENDDELQLPFNFFLSAVPELSASSFRETIESFEQTLGDRTTTLVLSNHDFERSTTRYAGEADSDAIAKLLATLLLTLRGIPFIYYGEELGLRDRPPETIEEVQDPRGRIRWPEYKGRDGCRTPMHWSSKPQAGFTTGQPWNKVAPDYPNRNVEAQSADENSILNYYKTLLKLRRSLPSLNRGQLTLLGDDPSVLAYLRSHESQQAIVLLNLSGDRRRFDLTHLQDLNGKSWQVLVSTHREKDDRTLDESIELMPFEGAIALLISNPVE